MLHAESVNLIARSKILKNSEYCFANLSKFWFDVISKSHASEKFFLTARNSLMMILVTDSWTEENMNLTIRVEINASYAYLKYLKFVNKIFLKFQKNILISDLFWKFEDHFWVWFNYQKAFSRKMISHKN